MKLLFLLMLIHLAYANYLFFKAMSNYSPTLLVSSLILTLVAISLLVKESLSGKKKARSLSELKVKINSLAGVSDQIASTSSNLSEGAVEQSEQLQQSVSAMDEINATLLKNSDSATESLNETKKCLDIVNEGQVSMNDLENSFKVIRTGNQNFEQKISENNKSFDQIKNVISEIHEKTKIINDIVFQTKLLSFNASVEAARAGEHGKGFAVVAEEIGSLASMSGNAAKEISSILDKALGTVNSIIDNSAKTVGELVNEATRNIEAGSQKVSVSLKNFFDISESVSKVSHSIGEIAKATSEQSIGVTEVSKSIYILEQNNQRSLLVAKQSSEIAISLNDEFKNLDNAFEETEKLFLTKDQVAYVLPQIEWSDKYLIGVTKMDNEHKELISLINCLISALNTESRQVILGNFKDLKEYTLFHFAEEEVYMESIGYPDISAHKKIHENMINQFLKFEKSLQDNELDKKKFLAFLKNWLISHILGVDTQYAAVSM